MPGLGLPALIFCCNRRTAWGARSAFPLQTGMERGIKMRIHVDSVPAEELFMRACQARGLIHFAEKDNNPRV